MQGTTTSATTLFNALGPVRERFGQSLGLPRHVANEACVEYMRWQVLTAEGLPATLPRGSLVARFGELAGDGAAVAAGVPTEQFSRLYADRFGSVPPDYWFSAPGHSDASPGRLADASPGRLADASPGRLADASPGRCR